MKPALQRIAGLSFAVAAGAAAAALAESLAAVLQPPRADSFGHALATFAAAASSSVLAQLAAVALLSVAAVGLRANPTVRRRLHTFLGAVSGDGAASARVVARVLEVVLFFALAVPAFFATVVWAEDAIATNALRAPFVAFVDAAVVVGAWLVVSVVGPVLHGAVRTTESRLPRAFRRTVQAAFVVGLAAAVTALVLRWDYVATADIRIVAFVGAALVGAGVGHFVYGRALAMRHRPLTTAVALTAPILVAFVGQQVTIRFAATGASVDATIRSAGADLAFAVLSPSEAVDVQPAPESRVRAPSHVTLPAQVPEPKHLIVLSIDALRADRLGLYGYRRRPTSPNLDRIARSAAVFDEAFCQSPASLRSIPSAFMSLYPHAIPWVRYLPGRMMPVPQKTTSLAEVLRSQGFRTLAVLHTRYIHVQGVLQGFDEVISDPPARDVNARARELRAERFVTHAIRSLDTTPVGDRRLFLWMHFIEPHGPYNPVPDFRWGNASSDRYDAEIRYTDRALGRFVEYLERVGIARDALFVLFSDHGEEFGEHGFDSHSKSLYRAGTRVPFLFWGRGVKPGRHRTTVGLLDLSPTVLDVLRRPPRPAHGASLAGTIMLGTPPPVRSVGTELFPARNMPPKLYSVQREGWKLVVEPDNRPRELFQVAADEQESRNLVAARPAIRELLRRDIAAFRALRQE